MRRSKWDKPRPGGKRIRVMKVTIHCKKTLGPTFLLYVMLILILGPVKLKLQERVFQPLTDRLM